MKQRNPYIGKWRIIEMEIWDQDFIDMETEGHFLFEKDQLGSFQFGLVQGQIDYREVFLILWPKGILYNSK